MQHTPGFYGKLPLLGDFINRRLPSEFIAPWDDWLQQSIASSKQQLQAEWLEYYLNSPIWRFVLCDGLCGSLPWMGVMMPSVDKVGRYYPLILACQLPSKANPIQVASFAGPWFELATKLVLTALHDENLNLQSFDAKVASLGGLENQSICGCVNADVGFGSAWQINLENSNLSYPVSALSHQLLSQRLGAYSIWWGAGSSAVMPSFLTCAQLPLPSDFASMLSGDWQMGSWEQWPIHFDSHFKVSEFDAC